MKLESQPLADLFKELIHILPEMKNFLLLENFRN
jgi:hypothetical protein